MLFYISKVNAIKVSLVYPMKGPFPNWSPRKGPPDPSPTYQLGLPKKRGDPSDNVDSNIRVTYHIKIVLFIFTKLRILYQYYQTTLQFTIHYGWGFYCCYSVWVFCETDLSLHVMMPQAKSHTLRKQMPWVINHWSIDWHWTSQI